MKKMGSPMSSEENIIRKLMRKVNTLLHSQFILLYLVGLKRLFYHRAENESEKKVSFLKILIFLLYLSAFVLAFLQFAEINIPSSVQEEWKNKIAIDMMENFPLSMYGELAHLINVIIVISIFYFFITQDRPISYTTQSVKTFILGSKRRKQIFFIIVSFLILLLIYQTGVFLIFPETFEVAVISISYKAGKGFSVVWVVLQPFLVFTGLLLTFDLIAKDFPKPFKNYNRFNITVFILTLLFVFGISGLISIIFGIYFRDDFSDSMEENFQYSSLDNFPEILYSASGISFLLVGLFTITMIIVFFVILEIYMKHRKGITRNQERRRADFLFLFPFLIIFVLSKALPFSLSFSLELQSLNDILDIFSLVFVMIFAVFRVLAIRDSEEKTELTSEILFKPKEWLNFIPTYCKVLIVFYLAFISFYTGLEANTIITLSGAVSNFDQVQMQASIGFSFVVLILIFWRYKPDTYITSD